MPSKFESTLQLMGKASKGQHKTQNGLVLLLYTWLYPSTGDEMYFDAQ